MATPTTHPAPADRSQGSTRGILCCGLGLLMLVAALAATASDEPVGAVAAALLTLGESAPAAVAWMLGAWGLGLASLRCLRASDDRAVALAVGVGLMLWLSHVLGLLGCFQATPARLGIAWLPIVLGIALLSLDLKRRPLAMPALGRGDIALLLLPGLGVALMLIAACIPPGTLWRSEASQFDTLSYHLQLPREWLATGRLWPMEHNAYSWLPSSMEAAFLHLAAMTTRPGRDPAINGLPSAAIHGAQILHVLMAAACAWLVARTARTLTEARDAGVTPDARPNRPRSAAGLLAGSLVLLTPWIIVVASCAYNEMAVCLLLTGAILAALREDGRAWKRGLLAGILVGAACGAKPTAIFMVGAPVGILLLASTPPRRWATMLGAGVLAGLLMLGPWLARNALACENPVFPYGSTLFGNGPWTALELARWAAGHHSAAGFTQRAALLASDRGFLHAQWSVVPMLILLFAGVAISRAGTRRAAWPLAIGLSLQVVLWAMIGHQQSRFLVPTVILGALLASIAVAATRHSLPRTIGVVLLQAVLACSCIRTWMNQNNGTPGIALIGGVDAITGDLLRRVWPDLSSEDRERIASDLPTVPFVNLLLGPRPLLAALTAAPPRLYLLGDSTPLYFQTSLLWHTTWSISPIGTGLRKGLPLDHIVQDLMSPITGGGSGITHVLVNFDELARLRRDGWYDPSVTADVAARIVREHGRIIKAWPGPDGGSVLIELTR